MIDLFGRKAKREHEAAVLARHRLETANRTIEGLMREIEAIRGAAEASARYIEHLKWAACSAQHQIDDLSARNRRLRENRGLPALRRLDAEGKV